ncbi:MAG: hypothetical protein V4663_06000 [Bacteroidota bacterium]
MPPLVDGLHLNQYVAPELLVEFRNYKDDFMAVLPGAPAGAITADGLRMNKLINNVNFLINNADPFTATAMDGKKGIIEWDKLDTSPTKVTDAEIRSVAFDKRSEVRVKHAQAWKIGVRDYVLRKLAPPAHVASAMPVIRTTGADDGFGRKRMTYDDFLNFYAEIELLNLPDNMSLNFIFNPQHVTDLRKDKANTNYHREGFVIDPSTGKLKRYLKWNLWENNSAPIYLANGSLKAAGASAISTDRTASTFFTAENTVHHVNEVKVLYKPETIDTTSADPTSEFRLQSYALCNKKQDYGFGALVSGIV